MRRVLTVDERGLTEIGQRLLDEMALDGFVPDAMIGIATGGARIVDTFPLDPGIAKFTVSVRRQSSTQKDNWGAKRRLIRALPYAVLDMLRRLEDLRLARTGGGPPSPSGAFGEEIMRLGDWARGRDSPRLVVVDDAIDSGQTMRLVVESVREIAPSADVRSAVVATSRSTTGAVIRPQYVLLTEVLVRYPWSLDYKGRREV